MKQFKKVQEQTQLDDTGVARMFFDVRESIGWVLRFRGSAYGLCGQDDELIQDPSLSAAALIRMGRAAAAFHHLEVKSIEVMR